MCSYSRALCHVRPNLAIASATLAALCALETLVCNKCSCTAVYMLGAGTTMHLQPCSTANMSKVRDKATSTYAVLPIYARLRQRLAAQVVDDWGPARMRTVFPDTTEFRHM